VIEDPVWDAVRREAAASAADVELPARFIAATCAAASLMVSPVTDAPAPTFAPPCTAIRLSALLVVCCDVDSLDESPPPRYPRGIP
jgi:hypothetical protein